MTPPKKTCYLVIPKADLIPSDVSPLDYAVEQHDHYMKVIAESLCSIAGTEYHHPMTGVWILNGYDDWAGILQDSLDDAGLKYSGISAQDDWFTHADSRYLVITSLLDTITNR